MRVFVTGATGWIGSAVVPELVTAGHEVHGLARTSEKAEQVRATGATPVAGDLDDLAALRAAAESADAVVHLGFKHDFTDMASASRTERAVVEAFGEVLAGTDRPLLIAADTAGINSGDGPVTEELRTPDGGVDSPRGSSEALVLSYADRGIRSVSVRFAPTVHGEGDHGFVRHLIEVARERGVAGYVGEGDNRWAAVHRSDAARLVRLALESPEGAPAGSAVHAVAESGIPTRQIAEAMARGLGVATESIAPDRAMEELGWIGRFWSVDMEVSNTLTRERLGWAPTGPSLMDDLGGPSYFAGLA